MISIIQVTLDLTASELCNRVCRCHGQGDVKLPGTTGSTAAVAYMDCRSLSSA